MNTNSNTVATSTSTISKVSAFFKSVPKVKIAAVVASVAAVATIAYVGFQIYQGKEVSLSLPLPDTDATLDAAVAVTPSA